MKIILLSFLFFTSASSCSSDNNNSDGDSFSDELKPQVACETISNILLTEMFGWELENIFQQSLTHNEKRSICSFGIDEEKLFVRLGWKSEKAQEMKTVENQFKNYLSNGENGINYSSLKGDELLYGSKTDQHNNMVYILRKRYGNKAEIQLEFYTPNRTEEEVKKHLLSLLNKF